MTTFSPISALRTALLGAALLGMAGCATQTADGSDPLEGFNRGVYAFNKGVDTVVLRPVAIAYKEVVPDPLRDRIRDFLNNLKSPVILANDLMQGEWDRAEITFRRFFINTTIGLGGLIDIASSVGIPRHTEDFGQTMAVAGVGPGPYIVLPLLGPSNGRDAVGKVVDFFLDPFNWYTINPNNDVAWLGYTRFGVDAVDERSRTLKLTDDIERDAVDPYARYRSLYSQYRASEISNGRGPRAGTGNANEPAYPGQAIR